MDTWTLEGPDKLDLGQVHRVEVQLVEGAVDVVGTDDQATLELSELEGEPLRVRPGRDRDGRLRAAVAAGAAGLADRPGPAAGGAVAGRAPRLPGRAARGLGQPDGGRAAGAGAGPVRQRRDHPGRAGRHGRCRVRLGGGAGLRRHRRPVGQDRVRRPHRGRGRRRVGAGQDRLRGGRGRPAGLGERDIDLSSVSGDLTVRLPGASDLQVKLQSTSGQVASAFEELEHERTPGRSAARGTARGRGTGRLRATSTSGHVALLRRAPEASL